MVTNDDKPLALTPAFSTSAIEGDLLNYKEAARMLNVPKGTLYAWVHRREVPFVRLGKRLVRFSRSALHAWLNARAITPAVSAEVGR